MGAAVGTDDGATLGVLVGAAVGADDGAALGMLVGAAVGADDGSVLEGYDIDDGGSTVPLWPTGADDGASVDISNTSKETLG